jgi:hypothetical protein
MVDLTITVANVDWVSGVKKTLDAAETITAGDCLYMVTSSTCGVANVTDAAKDAVIGIALNDGTAGHPITYAVDGAVVGFGAILTVGVWYCLSATGAIAPVADLATSDYISYVGYGITTSNMQLKIINTGLQFA